MKTSLLAIFLAALVGQASSAHAITKTSRAGTAAGSDAKKATGAKRVKSAASVTLVSGTATGRSNEATAPSPTKKPAGADKARGPQGRSKDYKAMRDLRPEIEHKVLQLQKPAGHDELLELPAEDYKESSIYGGSRETTVLAAANTGGKVHKLLWFHGTGQIPNNLIIRRLARAFAAEQLAVEVHSVNYEERGAEAKVDAFLAAQAEPVVVGGHSAGSGLADMLASFKHPKIKAAILLNGASGNQAVVPTLQLKGSVMDGKPYARNPLVVPVQVMNADHSLRYHAPDGKGPRDKDVLNRSVNTWNMNRLVAQQIKSFVEGLAPAAK